MSWQSLSLHISREHADAFGDALLDHGAISVNVDDADADTASEQPIFGEPGADTGLWRACRLTALFPQGKHVPEIVEEIFESLEMAALPLTLSTLEDEDWVKKNQAQFQPIKISRRLWIVPTWHEASDATAINISLDPGAAFGTGSHPTTRLCLHWLEAHVRQEDHATVLDYGSGSGILAIAAMKLGAASAFGVDIDPAAVTAAEFNAAQNGVIVNFSDGQSPTSVVADILLANILANPLRVLAPLLAAHTKPGGSIVLAGILDAQAEELIDIYRPWFEISVWKSEDGWSCLAGRRRVG